MKRLAVALGMLLLPAAALAQDVCPPSRVINLAVADAGKTTMVLTWTDPGDDCSTGTPTSFEVRRSSGPITESNYYSATVVVSGASPGQGSCFAFDGLTCNTTYYFAITFLDDAGNRSPVSNSPSGATTGCVGTPEVWCLLERAKPGVDPIGSWG